MAKNDTLLIDGIIDDRVSQLIPSDKRDEAFEYFAIEQILRDADLSRDDIEFGWVDGGRDGGIDGFYVFINGHLLKDPATFYWPKIGSELDLWIITCKHHESFKQAPIDNLVASLVDLLDFSVNPNDFSGIYSPAIIKARQHLATAYRKVSPRLSRLSAHFVYASRGDTTKIGDEVKARAQQAIAIAKDSFAACAAKFNFLGAAELIEKHRQVRTLLLELPFTEALTRGERYVLLCPLRDFYSFIVDETKSLRRYLFESNVRAFMGLNRVNEDIRETLEDNASPDFWWLNNGVTILANSATTIGKSIQMEGVQIVNGLQTTESIWRYFRDGGSDSQDRSVLVKVIVSTDPDVRDSIIRATNNQTPVQLQTLHAMDKVQHDIEQVLLRAGLFYERRTNYYKNQGHPESRIITPIYVAAAFVNLGLRCPTAARKLKSKFMRSDDFIRLVFSESTPLSVWPVVSAITKRIDAFLESVRGRSGGAENFLKSWRHQLALVAVAKLLGRFGYTLDALCSVTAEQLTDVLLSDCWTSILKAQGKPLSWVVKDFALEHGLSGAESIDKRFAPLLSKRHPKTKRNPKIEGGPSTGRPLTDEFLARVNQALPDQPWPSGINKLIAITLGCSNRDVSDAIGVLMQKGVRLRQQDGIVYSSSGEIVARDASRFGSEQ